MAWIDRATDIRRRAMSRFLTAATYTPAGGSPFAVNVVFHAAAERAVIGDLGVPVSITRPVADVLLSDFASTPAQDDTIVINGVTYEVDEPEPESVGVGMSLILRLVQ